MPGLDEFKWDANGLLPAVVQDAATRQVLMLGWMNAEALRRTLTTGYVTFWSRSRQEYWLKGETSGNVLVLAEASYDCDGDALLLHVYPQGPVCHTGEMSCFFNPLTFDALSAPGPVSASELEAAPGFQWPAEAAQGEDSA